MMAYPKRNFSRVPLDPIICANSAPKLKKRNPPARNCSRPSLIKAISLESCISINPLEDSWYVS